MVILADETAEDTQIPVDDGSEYHAPEETGEEIDPTDINLMVAFGLEDQLEKTLP